MVAKTPKEIERRKVWLIVGYRQDGEFEAYLTDRDTMVNDRERAVEYQMESLADAKCAWLNDAPGYRAFLWTTEETRSKWPAQ